MELTKENYVNTCLIFTLTRISCSLKMRLTVACPTPYLSAIATCPILLLSPSSIIPHSASTDEVLTANLYRV
jgi:hypothetical protein